MPNYAAANGATPSVHVQQSAKRMAEARAQVRRMVSLWQAPANSKDIQLSNDEICSVLSAVVADVLRVKVENAMLDVAQIELRKTKEEADNRSTSKTMQRLKKVVSEQVGIPVQDIDNDDRLIEDLGADSIELIEIAMGVESEFDIDIPDDVAEELKTIDDYHKYLVDVLIVEKAIKAVQGD